MFVNAFRRGIARAVGVRQPGEGLGRISLKRVSVRWLIFGRNCRSRAPQEAAVVRLGGTTVDLEMEASVGLIEVLYLGLCVFGLR